MNIQRLLPAALAAALSATAFTAVSQPVDPAAPPVAEDAATERQVALEEDRNVDRNCLEETGSRVTADSQPATRKDHSEQAGHDCAIGNGTVYTRGDIDSTGRTTVKEALQALDPRVF